MRIHSHRSGAQIKGTQTKVSVGPQKQTRVSSQKQLPDCSQPFPRETRWPQGHTAHPSPALSGSFIKSLRQTKHQSDVPICIFRSRRGDEKRCFVHIHYQCWFEHCFSAEALRSLLLGSPPGAVGAAAATPGSSTSCRLSEQSTSASATSADGPGSAEVEGERMTPASKISKSNIF